MLRRTKLFSASLALALLVLPNSPRIRPKTNRPARADRLRSGAVVQAGAGTAREIQVVPEC